MSVAFSPDGKRIVSASDDGTLKVWDSDTGSETFTLRGHTAGVGSVAFSPDGKHIVSGSQDRTLKVWDARHGQGNAHPQGALTDGHVRGVSAPMANASSVAATTVR